MHIAGIIHGNQSLSNHPASLIPYRREKVPFPFRKDVEALCFIAAVCFFFTFIYLFHFLNPNFDAKTYLYPCNVSMSIHSLHSLRQKINITYSKLSSMKIINDAIYKSTLSPPAAAEYATLKSHYEEMEDNWNYFRNIYFECYKSNILKAFYRRPGYFLTAYYFVITVLFTKLFILLKRAKSCELEEVQVRTVNGFYMNAIVFWTIHLFISPFLVWFLFSSDDVSNGFIKEFPIYPHL